MPAAVILSSVQQCDVQIEPVLLCKQSEIVPNKMKDILCVSVFVVLLVVSSGHRNETIQGNPDKDISIALNENRTPQTEYVLDSTKDHENPPHRHRHHRGENALENAEEKSQKELRCARYTKNLSKRMAYYGRNVRENSYTPTRCYQQYCSCLVSTCRRRCPYQRPTSIYESEGKDWYGPKHGECMRFCGKRNTGNLLWCSV